MMINVQNISQDDCSRYAITETFKGSAAMLK